MKLGRAIQIFRTKRNLNQKDLAISSGISQTYLSLIENDVKEPTLATLKSICYHLNIPLPVLLVYAMNEEDVSPEKKEAFRHLSPLMHVLVDKLL